MPIPYIDVTKDLLYLQGFEEGLKKERAIGIEIAKKEWEQKQKQLYLKLLSLLSIEEITARFDVSIDFLEALKKEKEQLLYKND